MCHVLILKNDELFCSACTSCCWWRPCSCFRPIWSPWNPFKWISREKVLIKHVSYSNCEVQLSARSAWPCCCWRRPSVCLRSIRSPWNPFKWIPREKILIKHVPCVNFKKLTNFFVVLALVVFVDADGGVGDDCATSHPFLHLVRCKSWPTKKKLALYLNSTSHTTLPKFCSARVSKCPPPPFRGCEASLKWKPN